MTLFMQGDEIKKITFSFADAFFPLSYFYGKVDFSVHFSLPYIIHQDGYNEDEIPNDGVARTTQVIA